MSLVSEETLDGKYARRAGAPRNPPHPEGTRDAVQWLVGWDCEDRFIRKAEAKRSAAA